MRKVIIIKYGELTTKKGNINLFINTLNKNIQTYLADYAYEEKHDAGRMFIIPNESAFDEVLTILKSIFGIHEFNLGYETTSKELEDIAADLLPLLKEKAFNTFKVLTKRSDKSYPINSMEVSRKMGGYILKNIDNVTVDVNNPDVEVNIEIRKDYTYFYFDKINGAKGYPVGVAGKGLLMLSGGIDSPVAGYLAIKRGVKLEAIYFESPPHTSDLAKDKVMKLATKLANYNNTYVKVHVINFTPIQEAILKNIPHDYLITIMRRMMYRISKRIALMENCKIIVNGESIGQVASQTLNSMNVINHVVDIPVIRPVACLDKLEIIEIAKKINTYDTSILPYIDCCTIFVPEHPVINPTLEKCAEYEALIPYEDLIKEAIKTKEVVKVSTVNKNTNSLL
ncbi:MAG: tRNA 4-thiouridine(8) synthase ThiI [Bacilli bacterium]|nr:tRNA 4-thiouridine(8) synthase ThiI [Bacilli bacterium]